MMEMLNFIYTDIVNFFLPSMKWSIVLASTCTVLTSFSVAQFLLWIKGNRLPRHGKLPPGPPSWGPLVGNLPQFRTSMRTPHVRAQELAKTYGPVMRVQMGGKVLIFISDPKIADRCFKDNDHNFANRPSIAAQKYLLYGGDHPSLAPIGDFWRSARKLYTTELLSGKKLQEFQVVRSEEMGQAVQDIYEASARDASINMHDLFTKLFTNVITRMTMSRRFFNSANSAAKTLNETDSEAGSGNAELNDSMGNEWQQLIDSNHELMTRLLLEDVSPALAWVDILTGVRPRMQNSFARMDRLLQKVVDDHKAELSSREKDSENLDFIDVLLMLRDSSKTQFLSDRTIKAFSLDTIGAASETSTVTSEWALSELLTNPEVMDKAREEVDSVVGKDRTVLESDLPNMPYIRALVNESLRLHPPLPWLVPHTNLMDCTLEDYNIPANSILMFQVWAMQRDPLLWERALEFDPSRFLNSDMDVKGMHTGLMPFGAGRRMCPGYNLGLTVLQYTLARLIHSFDWSTTDPQVPLDMTEKFGLTSLRRASVLHAKARPRLPHHLYTT
ncbi:protein MpCYP75-like [Marchantia polymorpha subsp. ruderalis]|uniref:Cytochrome P450 n=3 Tax=Marchantia polymorpha TaxID=3197 RepID=A0AAF6BDN4_MARPO|nr:hypothetical protein MARPO_0197s0009 [Marchantia polymorpha]BBN10118.1 hypothetical protein Mp_5g01150 [Marchantia polymorpha subsp. ruderalis]|eukprot:PTQ27460.1 hypothetical protein MARPO_0197s0009 [Marchantia polymorpha]